MLTITDGVKTLTVTKGAFNSMFAPQGWEEVTTRKIARKNSDLRTVTEDKEIIQDRVENTDFPAENDAENDEIDLSEIPLSEMNVPQLKTYAKQLGIEVNTDSAKALRVQIRKILEA